MTQLKLPQKVKNTIEDFIRSLESIFKKGLISVILYGSAASGEFSAKISNINLLIVLDNAGLDNLNKFSRIIVQRRFRLLSPLFFTEDYIKNSKDVFPIEFLDMKENFVVLFGKDCLRDLEIDAKNLRFQCEQELKAKLISIKHTYLRNKEKYALRNLLFKSFTSIIHILRNLLRLQGISPPYLKEELLVKIGEEFKLDTAGFSRILIAKQNNLKLSYRETESLFSMLAADLEKIADIVDRL